MADITFYDAVVGQVYDGWTLINKYSRKFTYSVAVKDELFYLVLRKGTFETNISSYTPDKVSDFIKEAEIEFKKSLLSLLSPEQKENKEKRERQEIFNKRKNECYNANFVNGKFSCPECGWEEGGSERLIPHPFNCLNKGKQYCQRYELPNINKLLGGKKRKTKRVKRSKKTRKHKKY